MLRAGFKFCGGCDPLYDRLEATERIAETCGGGEVFEAAVPGRRYDLLVIVRGCPRCQYLYEDIEADLRIICSSEQDPDRITTQIQEALPGLRTHGPKKTSERRTVIMTHQDVLIEKREHVAIVKIEHMQAMNALSTEMYTQLENAFTEVSAMDDVFCVVLTGSSRINKKGKEVQSFVAGADISEMAGMDVAAGKAFGINSNRVCRMIENFRCPVIAAVNGFCLGGGLELAMSCDIRIASENAVFGQPEVSHGITPGCGGTQRLARIVGIAKAKEMLYTGRADYTAADALAMGLVNAVYPLEDLMDEALKLAEQIASQAPVAVSLVKEAVNVGLQADLDTALRFESNVFSQCFATEDQKYAMQYFLNKDPEKGPKKFKNR